MVRPIKSPSVDALRKEMLKYTPFKKHYSERISSAPLKDLVYLARNEMKLRASKEMKEAGRQFHKNGLGRVFYEDSMLIDGINTYALNLAHRAGIISNFGDAYIEDRAGYASKAAAKV